MVRNGPHRFRRCARALRPGSPGPWDGAATLRPSKEERRAPRCGPHAGLHAQGRPMNRRLFAALAGAALLVELGVPAPVAAANPQRPAAAAVGQGPEARQAGPRDRRRPADRRSPPRCAAPSGSQQVVIRLEEGHRPAESRARRSRRPRRQGQGPAGRVRRRGPRASTSRSRCSAGRRRPSTPSIATVDAKPLAQLARDPRGRDRSARSSTTSSTSSETVPYIGGTARPEPRRQPAPASRSPSSTRASTTRTPTLGGPGTALAYKNAFGTKLKDTEEPEDQRRLQGREAVPDRQGRRRLGLRRRVVGRRRGQPAARARPRPDPVRPRRHQGDLRRLPRHPRRRHHRGQEAASRPGPSSSRSRSARRVSTSCSGVALIEGMDFAHGPQRRRLDRRRRGHHQHVARLAVRPRAGRRPQRRRPERHRGGHRSSWSSAGNSGDKPYVVGSPSSAPRPSRWPRPRSRPRRASRCRSPHRRPVRRALRGRRSSRGPSRSMRPIAEDAVQYGDGAGGNLDGCLPFAAAQVAGKIVLDRPRHLQLQREDRERRGRWRRARRSSG